MECWLINLLHACWRTFIYVDPPLMSGGLTGDECKEPSSFEVAAHQKEKRGFFFFFFFLQRWEDSRIRFDSDSLPRCAFVDYSLVFPGRHHTVRQAADRLTEHTSGNLSMLAKRNSRSQNKGCVLPGMERRVNALLTESLVLVTVIRFWCKASPHGVMDGTKQSNCGW